MEILVYYRISINITYSCFEKLGHDLFDAWNSKNLLKSNQNNLPA